MGELNARLNDFSHKVAHAVLGCVGGAASGGGGSGCAAGAAGALVGELAASYRAEQLTQAQPGRDLTADERADVLAFAKLVSATAGVVVGGGGENAQAVNTAAMTGGNAAENNFLDHRRPSLLRLSEAEQYEAAAKACAEGVASGCVARNELALLSRQRDENLARACNGGAKEICNFLANQAAQMGNRVYRTEGGFAYANSPESPMFGLNTATMGPPRRPESFNDSVAKSTSDALLISSSMVTPTGMVSGAVLGLDLMPLGNT